MTTRKVTMWAALPGAKEDRVSSSFGQVRHGKQGVPGLAQPGRQRPRELGR